MTAMACNCGNKRRDLGATSPEVVAMQQANEAAQRAAEALIVAQAAKIATEAVAIHPDPEISRAS